MRHLIESYYQNDSQNFYFCKFYAHDELRRLRRKKNFTPIVFIIVVLNLFAPVCLSNLVYLWVEKCVFLNLLHFDYCIKFHHVIVCFVISLPFNLA